MKAEDFRQVAPYDLLSAEQRQSLVASFDVVYLNEGQTIAVDPQIEAKAHLIIPFKGRGQWQTQEGLNEIIHPLESAGALALLSHSPGTFTALEEVLAYQLPAAHFDKFCQDNVAFRNHWTANLQEKRHALLEQNQAKTLTDFMMAQIRDAWLCPLIILEPTLTLRQATQALRQEHCTAALVKLRSGQTGIITSNDLLNAFADHDPDHQPDLEQLAILNPISIDNQDFLFNALLTMTEHNISHLLVTQQHQPIGILQQKTLLGAFANQSVLVAQQIERAQSIPDLLRTSETQTLLIQSLHTKGVKPRLISELISSLNRHLFKRISQLTRPDHLTADHAILALGSEGRQEQILRTDQDNALIWRSEDIDENAMAHWAQDFHDALAQLGFPDCPGNIMLTNALWRQSLSSMQQTAIDWIHHPSNESMMHLSILLDANTASGNPDIARTLLQSVRQTMQSNRQFLAHFAKSALQFDTPLGIFSHFITEKEHQHRWLDLKKGGIFPIVHSARVLACEQDIHDLSTHQRLISLGDTKLMEKSFASELTEALDFMQQLRLTSQLQALQQEKPIDNRIEPDLLNHLQRDLLKDALKLVDQLKSLLNHHYKLHLIS